MKTKNCPATYSVVGDTRSTWHCALEAGHKNNDTHHTAKDGFSWDQKLEHDHGQVPGPGKTHHVNDPLLLALLCNLLGLLLLAVVIVIVAGVLNI